jgi:hypothetical protein
MKYLLTPWGNRSHAAYIATGGDLPAMFAELYGSS